VAGIFISFEGIECAGKSTQHEKLCNYLKEKKVNFISTSEPGGTEIGISIRNIFTNGKFRNMASKTELFLLAAARHQHIAGLIKPYMEKGYIVITDRFSDSTVAYQAFGRGLDLNLIKNINDLATEGLYPDLTFLLDISPEKSLQRLLKRTESSSRKPDRIEQEKLDFFQKVRDGYFFLAKTEPARFKVLDADRDIDEIHREIINTLQSLLKKV